ncbi:polysaccharide pyruvyl transferase family protein [Metabacillus idriensis]|nr:polysaccharide pyruvyl transferase family protein [Metabacillus idriensis]
MRYIIIVGGELRNKGAQAMTFTVVDEMKKRYPEKEVVLFSSVFTDREKNEMKQLNFRVLPWTLRIKMKMMGFPNNLNLGLKEFAKYIFKGTELPKEKMDEIKKVLENADLMVDISGYALSSQQGYMTTIKYLCNIMIAEQYGIQMYLLPQSFGPFNYNENDRRKLIPLIEKHLQYPKKLYVREKDGLKNLKTFNLGNVTHNYDIVLQGEEYTISNIYREYNFKNLDILENSVAIIPNEKVMMHGNSEKLYEVYKQIISSLLENGKNVYLIRHSYEDLKINENIKKMFSNEDRVKLLFEDFNCIQIDNIIKQFDFIIASRYHSIIHAYKNSVPALVFGWAIKYQELLGHFSQEKYLFDVRESQSDEKVREKLDYLLKYNKKESKTINEKMKHFNKNRIFDEILI